MRFKEMEGALSQVTFESRLTSYQLMGLIRFLADKGVIDEDEVMEFLADYLTDFADELADMMVDRGITPPSRRGEIVQLYMAMCKALKKVSLEAPA